MRPILKISKLSNLQDARSSAAVGFHQISFDLQRGSMTKLSASMVWNMVQWLSGPEIVLELDVASLPELEEVKGQFEYQAVSLPLEEWEAISASDVSLPTIQLRVPAGTSSAQLKAILGTNQTDSEILFEISLSELAEAGTYADILVHCLLHFSSVDDAEEAMRQGLTPKGFAFHTELEEEPGFLDYERIDQLIEVYEDAYEED